MRRRLTLALASLLLASCSAKADKISIASVSPRTGSARGGESVTVDGSGFEPGAVVRFGQTPAPSVVVQSSGSLLVTTPMSYAGDADITVESGGKEATAPSAFRFLPLDLQFIDAPDWYLPDLSSLDVTDAVAADFDGDGDTDLLVAVRNGRARLLRNNGSGVFDDGDGAAGSGGSGAADGGWPSLPEGGLDAAAGGATGPARTWTGDTRRILAADLDADGDVDVFLCNGSGQSGRILLNDGTGSFVDAGDGAFPQTSDECVNALLADVDGDGRQDIVLAGKGNAGFGNGYVRVYQRTGGEHEPQFAPLAQLEPAADIKGRACGSITTSAPELVAHATLTTQTAASGSMSCAVDFDASVASGTVDVSFALPALAAVPDDLELDLQDDAAGTSVQISLVDANGETFSSSVGQVPDSGWKHVKVQSPALWTSSGGDANALLDLPLKSVTLSFGLASGVASGTLRVDGLRLHVPDVGLVVVDDFERVAFPAAWDHEVSWIAAGDLDQDGDDDLVVATEAQGASSPLSLVRNDTTKTAVRLGIDASAAFGALPDPVSCAVVVDTDSDGALDVLAISPTGQDRLLVNDGRGRFFDDTTARMPVDKSPGRFAEAVDLDRDRLPDLVIANDGAVDRLYLQRPSGGFVDDTPSIPLRTAHTLRLVPLDVEGDGDTDLFVLNRSGERSRLYVSSVPAKQENGGRD